jgi:hypothetical protein
MILASIHKHRTPHFLRPMRWSFLNPHPSLQDFVSYHVPVFMYLCTYRLVNTFVFFFPDLK